MKKILFFAAAATLLASCGNGNNYSVTMTLPDTGLNGDTVYLINVDSRDTIASTVVTDSVLKFEGNIEKDFFGGFEVGSDFTYFIVEPGSDIIIKEGKATGSPLTDKFAELEETERKFYSDADKYYTEYQSGRIDSTTYKNTMDSLYAIYRNMCKEIYQGNKDNTLGLCAFYRYLYMEELGTAEIEAEMASSPIIAQSKHVGELLETKRHEEQTAVGKMFTDFTVTDENGVERKLSDYVGKGDYVLADFWASWCGPCRAEIPHIKKVYDKYNGKGLTVLGIAVWDKPEDTQKAIDELQIKWPQITNAGSVPTDIYGINGIPHIILFGPDGTILARDLRGDNMIAKVDEVMKK